MSVPMRMVTVGERRVVLVGGELAAMMVLAAAGEFGAISDDANGATRAALLGLARKRLAEASLVRGGGLRYRLTEDGFTAAVSLGLTKEA